MTTTPRTDELAQVPWAPAAPRPDTGAATPPTETIPYAAQSAPGTPAPPGVAAVTPPPSTAPALNPPTWTGRKTAIAAALAIGISSMGAAAAAAALPVGSAQGGSQVQQGGFGPGGQPPGGGTGRQGGFGPPGGTTQQGPGGTSQLPGGQPQQAPADPNASTT